MNSQESKFLEENRSLKASNLKIKNYEKHNFFIGFSLHYPKYANK